MKNVYTHTVRDELQGLLLITAIIFLLCVPEVIPQVLENGLEIAACASSIFVAFRFFRVGLLTHALLYGVIALLYHPFLLVITHLNSWFWLDMSVAFISFLITFQLNKKGVLT
jgi:hypothetical protein